MSLKNVGIIVCIAIMISSVIGYISGRDDEKKYRCMEMQIMVDGVNSQLFVKGIDATMTVPGCQK